MIRLILPLQTGPELLHLCQSQNDVEGKKERTPPFLPKTFPVTPLQPQAVYHISTTVYIWYQLFTNACAHVVVIATLHPFDTITVSLSIYSKAEVDLSSSCC